MAQFVRRRDLLAIVASMGGGLSLARSVFAAPKTYKYKCPKCKLIQEYGTMGTKKCPNDGTTMIRQP